MEPHDIDRIETPVPARAPGRRWGALFGALGVASLIALTLSASVAAGGSPSPAGAGAGGIVVVGGPVTAGTSADVEKMEAAFTKYTACMREHGVDMPDPVKLEASGTLDATAAEAPAAGITVVAGTARALAFDPASEEFTAADKACSSILEDAGILFGTGVIAGPIEGSAGLSTSTGTAGTIVVVGGPVPAGSSAEVEKIDAAFTKYAACMREHGVEMPDPVKLEASGPLAPAAATDLVPVTGSSLTLSFDPASEEFTAADKACSPILEAAGIHSATITSTSVLDGAVEAPASH